MTREVTMETKVSRNTIYIGNTQIEVEESIPITDEKIEWGDGKGGSLSFTINTKVSRKILRWMTLGDRRHSRFMKQIVLLKQNPKHHEAIFRCLRYGNKIPRKYQRKYKEVIKQMKMPWQR